MINFNSATAVFGSAGQAKITLHRIFGLNVRFWRGGIIRKEYDTEKVNDTTQCAEIYIEMKIKI